MDDFSILTLLNPPFTSKFLLRAFSTEEMGYSQAPEKGA